MGWPKSRFRVCVKYRRHPPVGRPVERSSPGGPGGAVITVATTVIGRVTTVPASLANSSWRRSTLSFSEAALSVQSVPFGVFHVRIEQESRRESLIAPKAGLRWSYSRSVWLVDESLIAPKAGGRCSFHGRSGWSTRGRRQMPPPWPCRCRPCDARVTGRLDNRWQTGSPERRCSAR